MMLIIAGPLFSQVVISDDPLYVPPDTNYILNVYSSGAEQFRIGKDGGIKFNGHLEVDSLQVNGLLNITSEGHSFFFFPNRVIPPPVHDLLRVNTRYFTVMGGGKISSQPLWGMGVNTETPNNMLDVNGGDIDVNTAARGYMIADQYVLYHKGNITNLYAGVNAGLNNAAGNDNTVIGYNSASITNNLGVKNTVIGSGAGQNLVTANDFTFVGYQAGFSSMGGSTNTFIGSLAGFAEMGDENVFVGWMSGHNNGGNSYHNTFVGNGSGFSNQFGDNNTFIGISSGFNNTVGHNNVALGAGAGPGPGMNNLMNAVAIGMGAMVMNNNHMILGDNTMHVGIGLNLDPLGPQNKLEIDAGVNGMSPTLSGNTGASGLRLRDLHSATLTVPNPGPGVLSVDASGDVIYVPSASAAGTPDNGLSLSGPTSGAIHLGQSTGATGDPAQLLDNREIPMYGFNLYFKGDLAPNQDMVEIGDNTILALSPITGAKLNVQTQTEQSSGLFVNRTNLANNWSTYGLQGIKLMGTNFENVGVHGYAELDPNATPGPIMLTAIGVRGDAQAQSVPGTAAAAYGIYGDATNNQTAINYGGYFVAANSMTGTNYAVFGDALGIGGAPGPGTPAGPTYAGYFNGDVFITNTYGPSDQKLKKDIADLDGALDLVMGLKPHTYLYRRSEYPGMALPSGKQ